MTVIHKYILFLTLATFFACSLSAQQHSYVHYDVHDGLAGSTVYAMAQDKQGFMWFGTETGLSRWDGTHFTTFTTRDGLPDNEIFKIFVDSKNRVWVIPFNNTVAYYWKGHFHTRANDSVLHKISDTMLIESIAEDAAGNIFVERFRSIEVIENSGKITRIKEPYTKIGYVTDGIDYNGRIRFFYGLLDGKYRFGELEGDSLKERGLLSTHEMNSPALTYLGPDLQIWQEEQGMVFTDRVRNTLFKLPRPKGLISVSCIGPDVAMLNTYTNTYLVDIRQQKVVDSFLQGIPVNGVFRDSESNTWFCTLGRGVYRMGSPFVKNYFFRVGNDNVPVFSLQRFHHYLYIGADRHALYKLDPETGMLDGPRICGEGITRGRIMQMLVADSQTLILGTDIGIQFLKKNTYKDTPQAIKSLQLTRDSLVLFSSHMATRELSMKSMKVTDILWYERSTCSFKGSDGTYYIGTVKGLYAFKKGRPSVFLGSRWPILASRISAICEGQDGLIWIATNGNGLIGYREGGIQYQITEATGLTSNICRALLLKDSNIWIGTDKGLNKITPHDTAWTIIPYTTADGLASDIINAVAVEGNDVYVGTSEGMTYFDERNISKTSICALRIIDITVSNNRWFQDTTGFELQHKDNNISFNYVGISFKSGGSIVYTYRLLGLDTGWKTTKETFISYPSLPSGNYELQLTATNKFGVKSRMASVKFTVAKLLWEKTWFWALMLLLLAFFVFLLFRYRVARIRRKEAEKADIATRMAELEQMALRSQMNPHFIFNCLNSIQQYVIYRDVPGANEFISQFSHLIRTTLKISTCEVISLEEEIDYIRTYISVEKKRFDNKFNYEIVVVPEVDVNNCYIPPMILQPYIENAVRHGMGLRKDNKGTLEIRMEYRENYLVCIIEDSGVGRKLAAQYKSQNAILYQSMGMSLVAKRIEMYNRTNRRSAEIHIEDLVDNNGVGRGTKVSILFPLEVVLQ